MKVLAREDTRCPMEHKPRAYITDSKPVEVPDTGYYKRLVSDGSLVIVSEPEPAAPVKSVSIKSPAKAEKPAAPEKPKQPDTPAVKGGEDK